MVRTEAGAVKAVLGQHGGGKGHLARSQPLQPAPWVQVPGGPRKRQPRFTMSSVAAEGKEPLGATPR